jgi:DmsE family decaheme c-type cytochrome
MGRRHRRLVGVIAGVGTLALVVVVAGCFRSSQTAESPARATAPPAAQAPAPAAPAEGGGYVGAETCKGCHEEAFTRFSHTKMGRLFLKQPRNTLERLACEACHGPGKAHVDQGGGDKAGGKDPKLITFAKNDRTPIDQRNQVCLTCHTKGARLFWKGSPHEARDVACTNCHTVMADHSPKAQLAKASEIDTCGTCHLERRAQQMRSSHMPLREGKMSCTSCHNPHGTVTPALLKENSLNDNCYTCHTEKRGPFLWEHAPVPESCVNCHDPHGSNHEKMLKLAKPRLCQQCHIETRHPTNPYGRDTASQKFVLGRQCSSCHVNIHGSNHPSGFAFTR